MGDFTSRFADFKEHDITAPMTIITVTTIPSQRHFFIEFRGKLFLFVQPHLRPLADVVFDAEAAGGLIACQHGGFDFATHLDVQVGLAKCAALHNGLAGIQLDRRRAGGANVPTDEIAGGGGELSRRAAHPDTTINRPPERAVHQAHFALRLRLDFYRHGVGAAPAADEFVVRDKQTILLRLFNDHGTLARIRAQPEIVSVRGVV